MWSAASASIAPPAPALPRNPAMTRWTCVEDLEDEIVDRIDVPPGFHGRLVLASIVLRWMPFDQNHGHQQHDNPGRARSSVEERVAETNALGRAHRPL